MIDAEQATSKKKDRNYERKKRKKRKERKKEKGERKKW